MRIKIRKKLAVILGLLMILTSGATVNGYLTENGTEATILRLDREFSSTSSMVGKVETITYNLTGDTIVYEPPKEIALVVDVSGSMSSSMGGKTRIKVLKEAVTSFVEEWEGSNCKICIVPFSYYVKSEPVLVDMKQSDCLEDLDEIISDLTANGNTNIGDGMRIAYHTLDNSGNSNAAKYIITLTDGEPNLYTKNNDGSYKTGSGISSKTGSGTAKGLEYCTSIIGNKIKLRSFKSFVIGFATAPSLEANLNSIGTSSGAAELANGKYFYYAGSQTELNQVYTDISDIIASDVPFESAAFTELLPEGTVIEPAAVTELESQGFIIIDNFPDPDGSGKLRTKITKSLSGSIFLERKYPEATTSPADRTYQLKPCSFSISIVYTTPGNKVYKDVDASIDYDDPFQNVAYRAYAANSESVAVTQPVTGISNTDVIIMPDQNESPGIITAKVLPDTAPNIAYDKAIASWTLTGAVDATGASISPEAVISITDPAVPDPLNSKKEVVGLVAGKAYAEATSAGTTLDGAVVKGTSTVYVVDGKMSNILMNNGNIVNLDDFTTKFILGIANENMSFVNWRLKNTADAAYITVTESGTATAISSLQNNVPLLVDVDYTVGSPGSPEVHLTKTIEAEITVAQPVTGVTVTGTAVMKDLSSEVTAVVEPADAYNKRIGSWILKDETGIDVTSTSTIAAFTSSLDPNNCEIGVEGKGVGKVTVIAVSEGFNASSARVIGSSTIYVVDATCETAKTVTLWSSNGKIVPVSHIPEGALGHIKYTFTSGDASKVEVDSSTGVIKGLELTPSPVEVTILAQYCDEGGIPTGQEKVLTCQVSVDEPNIDIN